MNLTHAAMAGAKALAYLIEIGNQEALAALNATGDFVWTMDTAKLLARDIQIYCEDFNQAIPLSAANHDRFLCCESVDGERQFLLCLHEPRWIAEILDEPAGEFGTIYETESNQFLANFDFFGGDPPPWNELEPVLSVASEWLEQYDLNLGVTE
jgi:hypothetical protein